ncbi:hypothetical protein [Botrimarina sp.]|uniref:hypothetical protein n=1 Tax=Botrimarina sp. TaxID=2795802 RepID=UPI0032EDAEBF
MTLHEIGRGRASDTASFRAPPFHAGADGARVAVHELRTDSGAVVAQLAAVLDNGGAEFVRALRGWLSALEQAQGDLGSVDFDRFGNPI